MVRLFFSFFALSIPFVQVESVVTKFVFTGIVVCDMANFDYSIALWKKNGSSGDNKITTQRLIQWRNLHYYDMAGEQDGDEILTFTYEVYMVVVHSCTHPEKSFHKLTGPLGKFPVRRETYYKSVNINLTNQREQLTNNIMGYRSTEKMTATINVALTPEYDSIWQNCSNLGHDMIITTQIRRIFPTIEYMISGLEENKLYKMSIHMDFVDNYKLRFDNMTGVYTTSISREQKAEPKIVWHPKGSQSGQEWMSNIVSFDHVRITCKKILEAKSENIVHLLSSHRYIPVLTIYENNLPIHTAKMQHMVFNASTQYHSNGVREYKRSINKFSTKSEAEEKVGIVSSRKRSSNNPETLETAKQSKFPAFMMKDLIVKDEPSTSSVASPGPSGAGLSKSMHLATPKSRGKKSIKSIIPSPSSATSLLGSLAFGALSAPVSSNLSVLTPPITPGSHNAEVKTPPTTPTSQQIHGGAPPAAPLRPTRAAAVSPLCSTQPAPSPPLVAAPEFPMLSFPMMPMMVPLFNPFLNPLMVNMFPTQPITPFNNDTQTPPGAIDDNIDETAEIDIVN